MLSRSACISIRTLQQPGQTVGIARGRLNQAQTGGRLGALLPGGTGASARRVSICRVQRRRLLFDSDDYSYDEPDGNKAGPEQGEQPAAAGATPSDARASSRAGAKASAKASTGRRQRPETPDAEAAHSAGEGLVGLFVGGWMAAIALLVRVLQPVVQLGLLLAQPLTHMSPARARARLDKLLTQLPDGFWAKVWAVWELPMVRSIRFTASVANWGVRLPAIAAILLTQGSALATQVSLPMLAPLLLGTGMMLRSIKANASFIIPRLGLMVVLLWVLWFANSVIQTTWLELRNQGRIDARTLSGARMMTEISSLLLAGIVVLSMLGLNVNALLLPAGVVLAIASRDLLQNLIAGFHLVLVQPFTVGDRVAVPLERPASSTTAQAPGAAIAAVRGNTGASGLQGWFEGVCEKVDLRYTVLRDGRRRLMVPNAAFVSREFCVYDDPPGDGSGPSSPREAVIREGQFATELPPAGQPMFTGVPPGMAFIAPYQPYHHHQHFYPTPPFHPQQQQPDGGEQQQPGGHPGEPATASTPQAGSPQHSTDSSNGSGGGDGGQPPSGGGAAARGPGYLPQGFLFPVSAWGPLPIPGPPWSPPGSSTTPQHEEPAAAAMHQPVPPFEPQEQQPQQQPPAAHATQRQQASSTRGPEHHRQQPQHDTQQQAPRQPQQDSNNSGPLSGRAPGAASLHHGSGDGSSSSSSGPAAAQARASAAMDSYVARVSSCGPQHFGVPLPPGGYFVAAGGFDPATLSQHHVLHWHQQQYQQHYQQQQLLYHQQQQPASQQAAPARALSTTAAGDVDARASSPTRATPGPAAVPPACAPDGPWPLASIELPVRGLAAAAAAVAGTAAHLSGIISVDQI